MHPEIGFLLQLIDQGYDHKAWHGPNLRNALKGLAANLAARRPGHGRRSIAEHAVHAAYWKYIVRRRILGAKRGSFAIAGSNWFPIDEAGFDAAAWASRLDLLDSEHRALRESVEAIDPGRLDETTPGSKMPLRAMVQGIAMHDVYHAGQIGLIKRLLGEG